MATTVRRKLNPVPFTRVEVDDAFWSSRIEANRTLRSSSARLAASTRACRYWSGVYFTGFV